MSGCWSAAAGIVCDFSHLAVAICEAQLVHGGLRQSHVLEALRPETALERDVVDAESNLGVLELT